MTGSGTGKVTIRPFDTLDEFRACVALQEEVWGEGFSERVPVAILKVAQRIGGVASGAWDEAGRLVGFVFGMTGWNGAGPVHWSDMLAVRPGVRGGGVGLRLKAHQRELLLEGGVTLASWTFDPLESRNGWLNLARLGATSREYVRDMYGETDSVLHRGIGTDRLVVRWELDAPRVVARLDRHEPSPGEEALEGVPRALEVREEGGLPRPVPVATSPEGTLRVRIPIPPDIQLLKSRERELAMEWRAAVREAMEPRLSRGWEVREMVRRGNLSEYLLVLEEE